MDNSFAPFFQRIADAFIAGDIDWLVSCCSYPLALFVNGEVIVESCAEDSMAAIASRRKLVLGQGVTSILTKTWETYRSNAFPYGSTGYF